MNSDNVRSPPRNAPRTIFYRSNLRPVVIALAAIGALWSLFNAVSWFRTVDAESSDRISGLVPITIALGVIYIVVCLIETFGAYAAASRKVKLVGLYTLLSAGTTLAVLATGLLRVIIHFTRKDDLIDACAEITLRNGVAVYPFGFWGPVYKSDFDEDDAESWCTRSWNRGSWSEILSLICISFLAAFWTMIVYSYYRQLQDPASVANVSRVQVTTYTTSYPSHYNPPYNNNNVAVPHLGYGYNMPYAGGPPPSEQYGNSGHWTPPQTFAPPPGAPPGYTGNGSFNEDKKVDNPFEDFTEIGDSKNNKGGNDGPAGRS